MGIKYTINRILRRCGSDESETTFEGTQKKSVDEDNPDDIKKSDEAVTPETVPAGDTLEEPEKSPAEESAERTKQVSEGDIEEKATENEIEDTIASVEAAAPATAEQPESLPVESSEYVISNKDILCKFVVQGGEKIGETISIDSGHLVFKNGAEKLYIPMSSIIEITDLEVIVGEFDRDEALRLGEEWTSRTTDKLNFDEKGMLIND